MRVHFVTVMPSPYTCDLFAEMACDERLQLSVSYLEMIAPDTQWGRVELPDYARVLEGRWINLLGGRVHWNPEIRRTLRAANADIYVVSGYSGLTNQVAMRWLRSQRKRWVFWGELPGMRQLGFFSRQLRKVAQRPAVQWPNGIAAIGSRAEGVYRELSSGRPTVHNIPYACEMESFAKYSRRDQRAPSPLKLLYCGQLIPRKGVEILIKACCKLLSEGVELRLTLVGDGPIRSELESSIPTEQRPCFHFAGFQPVSELPKWFGEADLFVFPSRHDGWGVVINQAIAAGLPVVTTDAAGAAIDLVVQGKNGFHVPAGDDAAFADCIREYVRNPVMLSEHGQASTEIAQQWTPRKSVDRWVDLFETVLHS